MNASMKLVLSSLLCLCSLGAQAQVYKCMEKGKAVFTDTPCVAEGSAVRMQVSKPTEESQEAALKRRQTDSANLRQIDEDRERLRSKRGYEEARAEGERARKDYECDQLAKQSKSGYKAEEAKAQYFSRCYGSNRN